MVITESTIYWIAIADNISMAFGIGALILFLVTLFFLMFAVDSSSLFSLSLSICFFILSLMMFTGWILTPSSKALAAMKVLPAIVNNEQLQGVTKNALELTDEFLRDLLSEQIKKKGKAQ